MTMKQGKLAFILCDIFSQ